MIQRFLSGTGVLLVAVGVGLGAGVAAQQAAAPASAPAHAGHDAHAGHQMAGAVKVATAKLEPTQNNTARGEVTFTQEAGGVRVAGSFSGLVFGEHGFHIHEKGDCSAPDAASAGGHFNPASKPHAAPSAAERHAGDLGNLKADPYGLARVDVLDTQISLSGPSTIVGKAVIIHDKADDLKTQPTGNAGARVACGVIQAK